MRHDEDQDDSVLTEGVLKTPVAEAYRQLRVSLGFLTAGQPVKTILVTSGGRAEGKTTTVLNLGIIMAEAGSRVLLVDADLRRPSLHELLGWPPDGRHRLAGLSELLTGNTPLDDVVVQPTGLPRVSLLPAGRLPPNPNELLGSPRMEGLMAQLEGLADIILLDSPPCRSYADALLLSPLVDGVLYVVRSGRQDQAAQRRVRQQLSQARARILGVVFNDADAERGAGGGLHHPHVKTRWNYRAFSLAEES